MTTVWTASVTFLSFTYQIRHPNAYDDAIEKFLEHVPLSNLWKESCRTYSTNYTIKLTSRTKKNKVLRYLRKLHKKDDNLQWYIEKESEDFFGSDSSSDDYDGVHTCYTK